MFLLDKNILEIYLFIKKVNQIERVDLKFLI